MKHFDKTVDLTAYLPPVLRRVRELREITALETPVMQALWDAAETAMNDQFLSTAGKTGLASRERLLSITPSPGDTVEDRRFRLMTLYGSDTPYTRRRLEAMLAALLGADGYQIRYLTAGHAVKVGVALKARSRVDSVVELLERTLPYNMVFSVEVLFNRWRKLSPRLWGELAPLTWRDLQEKEGEIP